MKQTSKSLHLSLDDIRDMLAEQAEQMREETLRDDDLTALRVAEENGISETQARRMLNKMEKEGKLVVVKCLHDKGGGRVNAYRLPN